MTNRDKIFDAFRNCITELKCRDCPWEQCEEFYQKKVEIPVTLALDVIELLKEQETVKPKTENDGAPEDIACWLKEQEEAYRGAEEFLWQKTILFDDAIKRLKEQEVVVRCENCKHGKPGDCGYGIDCDGVWHDDDWFCADGEQREITWSDSSE